MAAALCPPKRFSRLVGLARPRALCFLRTQYTCCCPGFFQDLHVYDPDTMAWTDLSATASGTTPSARWGHGFALARGKLYVHGGNGDSGGYIRQR